MTFVLNLVQLVIIAAWVLVFGRILMTWFDPSGRTRVSSFLTQSTEPLLGPVRRALPATGAIDWSASIVLIVLFFLWRSI